MRNFPKRSWLTRELLISATILSSSACGPSPEPPPRPAADGGSPSDLASGGTMGGGSEGIIVLPDATGGTATGGSGGSTLDTQVTDACAHTEVSAVDTTAVIPVDILIVVDTSGSMVEEVGFVQDNLNTFSQQIIDSGVDARVILIAAEADETGSSLGLCIASPLGSGSCPADSLPPGYVHVPQRVAGNNALDVLLATYPEWKPHLRADSLKSVLVVSDDDAERLEFVGEELVTLEGEELVQEFLADWGDLDPEFLTNWTMSAVYAFTQCPAAASVGTVYERLVELTGGVGGDLCLQDFQPVFDRLAEEVVENTDTIVCEWEIPPAVEGQTFSTERVEVTRTVSGGATEELHQVSSKEDCEPGAWHFDDHTNPSHISACPETCEAMQEDEEGKIDVVFGCEIVQGCAATGATALIPDDVSKAEMNCEWEIPETTNAQLDSENLNVRAVTPSGFGVLWGQVNSSTECESAILGWHFDDMATPTRIIACPTTCTTLGAANVAEVQALFGCKSKPAEVIR